MCTPQFFEVVPEDVAFHQPVMHGSFWEAASPVLEWDGPWEKRPVSLWGFKIVIIFTAIFHLFWVGRKMLRGISFCY